MTAQTYEQMSDTQRARYNREQGQALADVTAQIIASTQALQEAARHAFLGSDSYLYH